MAAKAPEEKGSPGDGASRGARGLRLRLLLWISLIALGPIVLMAAQGYHCARGAIMESRSDYLNSVARMKTLQIKSWLREREQDMELVASFPSIGDVARSPATGEERGGPSAPGLLESIERRSPAYEGVTLCDLNGKPVESPATAAPHDMGALEPGLVSKLESSTAFVVGEPHRHSNGSVGVHVGFPLTDSRGQRSGYVVANLNLSRFLDPIVNDRTGLGRTGKVLLLDGDGRAFGAGDEGARLVPEVRSSGGHSGRHMDSSIIEYRDIRGVPVLAAQGEAPELGLKLLVEMDEAEAFSWFGVLLERAAIMGAAVFLLVLAAALRISSRLSSPLQKLAAVARRIASGHHAERLGPIDASEEGQVAAAFNRMLDELADREARLIQAASLAAVGELSSSIVHEMRNPLTSIKLNVQALRKKVGDDPGYAELAAIAWEQAQRLECMLGELLDYGKPIEPHVEPVEPRLAVEEVLLSLRKTAESKQVRLSWDGEANGVRVLADREGLRRALTNLVENAIHLSPPGGEVSLKANSLPGDANRVIFRVRDQGPGLTENARRNMFRPFFTTRASGIGLGLANVKKIVECQGGTIEGLNRPEGGAEFSIILPGLHE